VPRFINEKKKNLRLVGAQQFVIIFCGAERISLRIMVNDTSAASWKQILGKQKH
jgi:hypothetical protein